MSHMREEPVPPAPPEPADPAALRALVAAHQVLWDVWPEVLANEGGHLVTVGFELGLFGTHDHPAAPPLAGCPECATVYRALRRIAQSILPQEERDSAYQIGMFDRALYFSAQGSQRILLRIKILHREGFDRPIDECEVRCLHDMEASLAELGAHKGGWR